MNVFGNFIAKKVLPVENLITLDRLDVGQSAYIHSFTDNDLSLKLIEMGCVPGEKIILKNKTTLGGTLAISILGYMLGLRKEEAARIVLMPVNDN